MAFTTKDIANFFSLCTFNFPFSVIRYLYFLCKCLRQLVTRGNDQLKNRSSFGHCARFKFDDLCNLLFLLLLFSTFVMHCSNLLK